MHAETQLVSAAEELGEHQVVLQEGRGRIWRTHSVWVDLPFLPHFASDRVEVVDQLLVSAVAGWPLAPS